MAGAISSVCNWAVLDKLTAGAVDEILDSYGGFCAATSALLDGAGDLSAGPQFVSHVHGLCKHGLESLVRDHFLGALERTFERNGGSKFWRHFEAYSDEVVSMEEEVFYNALEEISMEKQYQEKCLLMLVHALQSFNNGNSDDYRLELFAKYNLLVSSVLMASLPRHFPEILHWYFKRRLEELSSMMGGEIPRDNKDGDDGKYDMMLMRNAMSCTGVGKWRLMNAKWKFQKFVKLGKQIH